MTSAPVRTTHLVVFVYWLLWCAPTDAAERASGRRDKLTHEGQALLDAAATNNRRSVRRLIRAFPDAIENRTRTSHATPLLRATWFGHVKVVTDLIRFGANVNACQFQGFTALHYCAQKGKQNWEKITDALVRHKADPNIFSNTGLTPLYIASEKGHFKIIEKLLKGGAEVDLAHKIHRATPLMVAAGNGQSAAIGVLLEQGRANQTLVDVEGYTALHRAARWGFTDAVRSLLEGVRSHREKQHLLDIASADGATALYLATQESWLESVQVLLENGANPDNGLGKLNATPLMVASEFGDPALVKVLARGGADLGITTKDGRSAIFIAAQNGNSDVVAALLDAGNGVNDASVAPGGITPFGVAILNDHWDVVVEFLERGVDVNSNMANSIPPLWHAANSGHGDLVDLLIKWGAKVVGPGSDVAGVGPVMVAAYAGYAQVVQSLIEAGGDVESIVDGWTALAVAIHRGHAQVADALLANGANVDANVTGGNTPLMLATRRCDVRIVKALLDKGAGVDVRNEAGITALHFSTESTATIECAKVLLEFGAGVDVMDSGGDTPLAHAAMYGNRLAVEALLGKGANPALPNANTTLPNEQICLCMEDGFPNDCAAGDGCKNSNFTRILEALLGAGA